jgi:NADPH-dependent 2,4-dienoyl-CoA reductase/sulfur reductase-like enzyme
MAVSTHGRLKPQYQGCRDDPASLIDYLIVGGGWRATAADTLRREGAPGSVVILSAEDIAPYQRPRLSKSYLVGASRADERLVHPVDFDGAKKIDLHLNVCVARVDARQRQVRTAAGEVIRYSQMLLAPGAAPREVRRPAAPFLAFTICASGPRRMQSAPLSGAVAGL